MASSRWKETKEFLHEALRLPSSERDDYLLNSVHDTSIREEVRKILSHESEIEDFMSLPINEFSKDFFQNDASVYPSASLIGQKVGNYKIVREIGGGGMGTVYLARRADGKFEQTVAIKLLRREFNNERVRRYFSREKEIQASLNHPNITRLLDSGTTDDGLPFLVMEYVEGIPVDKFCLSADLLLVERLKLFNKICDAVAAAHRSLIVHRDLKPSNILIDELGEPKLLDFGISKILASDVGNDDAGTMLGAMTPEYASPEQIMGEPLTTATDIYSLGVILFKILTGTGPYSLESRTNGNLLKKIVDSETILASEASVGSDMIGKIQAFELKGDLDTIISKSLHKDPEKRYTSVEQFKTDIWRFIDGDPIIARPVTFQYRARKFFQRNKLAATSAALIIISLLSGVAIALWQANVAWEQAAIAIESQKRSDSEKEKAEKMSRFMFKVFSYANPAWYAEGYKTGGQARVLDALEGLASEIETEFEGEIDIQAELHHRFAEVYGRVASYDTEPEKRDEMREKSDHHTCRALNSAVGSTANGMNWSPKTYILDRAALAKTLPKRLSY